MSYQLMCGDALTILPGLTDDLFDLVFFSPPYEDCRTYGIQFAMKGQEYVDWMVRIFTECRRVCKGLVACIIEGKTSAFRYSTTPLLLGADLHRAGFHLRKPPIFNRVGIPGSGGPDWLRNDYEFVICTTRGGKLPWSDNAAMGHAPKWALGGAMSYRNSDGVRKNESNGPKFQARRELGRGRDGKPKKKHFCHDENGNTKGEHDRNICAISNPGNVIEQTYTATQVAELLAEQGDVRSHIVGGGVMGGDEYCSQNEAPFPEPLAEFFIRSFCPPSGTVLDPTCGSGTTLAVAHRWGRNGVGIDVRQSQVDLSRKRLESETPMFIT